MVAKDKAEFLAGYTLSEPERDALMRPDWRGLLALGVLPNLVYRYYMMHGLAPESFPSAIAATKSRSGHVAQLCLGLATSHLAHIVNARNLADPKQVAIFDAGYRRLADALANAKPDVSLIISADHVNKFFIDNMPAFGIGMFDEFWGRSDSKTQELRRPLPQRAERLGFLALSHRARP